MNHTCQTSWQHKAPRIRRTLQPRLATCVEVNVSGHQLAQTLGNAVDAKDHSTHFHSEEVAAISRILAYDLGMSRDEAETIHIAGHLHDIGKIGIPDLVLQKPGKLTDAEWEIIKQHPRIGADIVHPITELAPLNGIAGIILHHHEKYDGSGYPHALSGEDIPIGARIIAVADSMSAMLQHRPYSRPMDFNSALRDILELSGEHYDPQVVRALNRTRRTIEKKLPELKKASKPFFTPAVVPPTS